MAHGLVRFRVGCRKVRRVLLGVVACLVSVTSAAAQGQDVKSVPRAASSRSASLARYVPRRELGLYFESQGLDAHVALWRGSAAYRLLNETKLGTLLEDLAKQGIHLAQQSTPRAKAAQVVSVDQTIEARGTTGISGRGLEPGHANPGRRLRFPQCRVA